MNGWKKAGVAIVLALFVLLVQGTLLRSFLPGFLIPNLMIVLVTFIALNDDSVSGALVAFFCGLLLDLNSGLLLGPWSAACILIFGVLTTLQQRLFVESALALAVVVSVASLAASAVVGLLLWQFTGPEARIIPLILSEALMSALVSPILFPILRRWLVSRREAGLGGNRFRAART